MDQLTITYPMTDRDILHQISELEKKITHLQQFKQAQIKRPQLFFFADYQRGDREQFIQLDQSNFPFNLSTEIKILIEDSIEDYTRDIETLKYLITIK